MIGKIIADASGLTEKWGGQKKDKFKELVEIKMNNTEWDKFQQEVKAADGDTIKIKAAIDDSELKDLKRIDRLYNYAVEQSKEGKDVDLGDVNNMIQTQNQTNIANRAHGIKGVKAAIAEYNKILQENKDDTTQASKNTNKFVETLKTANPILAECMTNANGSSISFGNYASSLATATLKTIGLEVATTAMNAVVSFGASVLIQALAGGISYLIHYDEKQKEIIDNAKSLTTECADAINSLKSEMADTTTKASELSAEFSKFVQGVDPLTNKNLSLSTEDYEKFLDVNKQLSDLFPSLTKNYDENGNAILGLSGDVNTVTESIAKLVEQQNNLAKAEIRGKLNDYVNGTEDSEGVFTALEGYSQDLNDAESSLKEFEDTYNSIIGSKDSNTSKLFTSYHDYEKYIDNIKDKFGEDVYEAIKDVSKSSSRNRRYQSTTIDFSALKFDDVTKAKITESYNAFVQDYKTSVDVAKSELESKNNEMSNMMMTWVEDIALYKDGGDAFQKSIQSMIDSIDWANLGIEDGNLDDAKRVIQEQVLLPLSAACNNPDTKLEVINALNKLFTVDFSKMSFHDANKMIEGFLTTIMEALNKGLPDGEKKEMSDMYEMFGLSSYSDTANKMKNSLANIAEEGSADYAKLEEYTSKFNQSQVEAWLSVTNGANNATDAIERYEDKINDASETESTPISFFEAWKSLGTEGTDEQKKAAQETKDKLLELAEAGRLTVKAFEDNGGQTIIDKTSLSVEEAVQKVNELVSSADQLSSMKTGISSISSIFGQKKENLSDKKTRTVGIGADTLAGMPEDVKAQTDEYEHFVEVLGDGTSKMDECRDAANKLATAYVNSENFLSNLTEENINYYISVLEEMGVENASTVVTQALENKVRALVAQKKYAKETGKELANQSVEEINRFAEENGYSERLKNSLYALALQKQLVNGTTLDTTSDIQAIMNLVDAVGTGSYALEQLQRIRNGEMNYLPGDAVNTIVKNAQKEVNKARKKLKKTTKVETKVKPITNSSNNDKKDKSKTSNNTVIDWISRKLDRLNSKISLTQAKYENLVDTLGKNRGKKKKKLAKNSDGLLAAQIENLDKQIKLYDKLAKTEKTAVKRYDKKAKNVNLSGSLKKAVRNGKIGTKKTSMKELIATYGEKKAKKIQEYEQWYDAARNAEKDYESARSSSRQKTEEKYQIQADAAQAKISMYQSQAAHATDDYKTQNGYLEKQRELIKKNYDMQIAIADLNKDTVLAADLRAQKEEELAQLEKQKFDNIQADFENRRSTYQMQMEVIEARNSLLEAKGQKIQASSYKNEIKQEQGNLATYKAEKAELEKQIKTIPKGTDEWYRAKEAINKCDVEIINCTANVAELNNKITELADNAKGALQTAFATMASEGDLFAELMSNKDMFDAETGVITREGLATLGTYGNGYNVTKTSAEMDQKLINKLNAGLNHDFTKGAFRFIDGNDKERVYNSLDQLKDAAKEVYEDWREQIKNTFEYESKIIDMMRDKLENELSALKDLIDAKKNALSAEKALHDYRKSIKESTQNISSLQKQIIAVKGDTSESGMARLQKLESQLKTAQEDLEEKEYDHLIQAEQDMLDNLYDEYSDLITNEMQDTRALLDKGLELIRNGTMSITDTIAEYITKYGYIQQYDNHMNSGSGDILNDAKGESSNNGGVTNLTDVTGSSLRGINSGKTVTPPEPKEQKLEVVKGTLFTKDELKKIKPKVEEIFDNKKLYKKGTSDGTAINDFLYKKNGKIVTKNGLKKLRNLCGTNDNDTMFEVLQFISKNIGQIKNVKGFKDGGIAKVVKSKGEDGIAMVRDGEGFVKPEHVDEVKKLMNVLPKLNAAMSYQIDLPKMPNVKSVQANQNQIVEIGNVTLPNVTNYDEFKTQMFRDMQKEPKFEKMVQSMTINRLTNPQTNRFSKNSIRF